MIEQEIGFSGWQDWEYIFFLVLFFRMTNMNKVVSDKPKKMYLSPLKAILHEAIFIVWVQVGVQVVVQAAV